MDKCGTWTFFQRKPQLIEDDGIWDADDPNNWTSNVEQILKLDQFPDWKDSLIERTQHDHTGGMAPRGASQHLVLGKTSHNGDVGKDNS